MLGIQTSVSTWRLASGGNRLFGLPTISIHRLDTVFKLEIIFKKISSLKYFSSEGCYPMKLKVEKMRRDRGRIAVNSLELNLNALGLYTLVQV